MQHGRRLAAGAFCRAGIALPKLTKRRAGEHYSEGGAGILCAHAGMVGFGKQR